MNVFSHSLISHYCWKLYACNLCHHAGRKWKQQADIHWWLKHFINLWTRSMLVIRPIAWQGSSPETRFSFLKHFRILYSFIANKIQINQRLCNNWHCKDLTQKNSKSVTLTLMSCTEIGMVQHKILDKALRSPNNWIKSIEGFAKKLKL